LENSTHKVAPPFKFNNTWLSDPEFTTLVRNTWHSMANWLDSSPILLLCTKLRNLKKAVVHWQSDKKKQLHTKLLLIEQKMSEVFEKFPSQVFSQGDLNLLRSLKQRKDKILEMEESTWRLRSRAIWIEKGDKNTKFFHKYATHRRSQNTIWDISDEEGCTKSTDNDIKEITYKHFKSQFKEIGAEDTYNQIKVIKEVPRFFNDVESDEIGKPVTLKEVEEVVSKMPRDKSPGPDGWTHEIFHFFFDLMGEDLVKAIEESRITGHIPGALNATFFALIPKVSKPDTFHDFRPIALCNFVYKVISKIIASRLKDKLASCISSE
jgi:hypothetical protein